MLDFIELVRKKTIKKPSLVRDVLNDPDSCVLIAEVSNGEVVIRIRRKEHKNDN